MHKTWLQVGEISISNKWLGTYSILLITILQLSITGAIRLFYKSERNFPTTIQSINYTHAQILSSLYLFMLSSASISSVNENNLIPRKLHIHNFSHWCDNSDIFFETIQFAAVYLRLIWFFPSMRDYENLVNIQEFMAASLSMFKNEFIHLLTSLSN